MFSEIADILRTWSAGDNKIVVTAALAAMACALPGNFLVVRRQSMMGDALSHTVLPGIVIAFLLAHKLQDVGGVDLLGQQASTHAILFGGALAMGVLAAVLTEWVQKYGRVETTAALGVVFTSLFALGLLLLRLLADSVHIDPSCVLLGRIESFMSSPQTIPPAAVQNGVVLIINLILTFVLFKELRLCAFDPALANSLGVNATWMHYGLMAVTAATLVAAFETVGSILVIAMLIVPPATAYLLTDKLPVMIGLSLVIAAFSAVAGHALAITVPAIIFSRLGFPTVDDASTAGMTALTGGFVFAAAMFLGPRYGIVSKWIGRIALASRIAREDMLGRLYRAEEGGASGVAADQLRLLASESPWFARWTIAQLRWFNLIRASGSGEYLLTEQGRLSAFELIRSHRLWESYMAKHFDLPPDHLHDAAERVEHFLDPSMRSQLAEEVPSATDPHGRAIPAEPPPRGESPPANEANADRTRRKQ